MERIIVENLKTEVRYSCDVLVCGGGFAGIAAAVAAARCGSKVILLEKQFMLGGLGTAGLVTMYLPICDGEGHQASYGLAEELLRLSVKYGGEGRCPKEWLENGTEEERKKHRFELRYNAQMFAILAERFLLENGVKILYGTSVCAAEVKDGKISAVSCDNKSGRFAVEAKSFVDCTGDADLCRYAGADTAVFEQKNVLAAWYYFLSGGNFDLKMLGFADKPDKYKTPEERSTDTKRYEGLDGEELSDMMCDSHAKILEDILTRREKGEKDIVPTTIATIPQIRMTRRIAGEYTQNDTEIRVHYDDSVGVFSDWRKRGPVYELPFRTLYGKKIKNLICAGRCISVTDAMWDITRVIPVCAVTGEAAGTAAALSDDFASLDVSVLREKLRAAGVKTDIDF